VPARKAFEIREPLHKYVTAKGERRVAVREGGMEAVTRARVVAAASGLALVELRLLTGRTHQIRVHLAHAGHPVLGDDKYGDFELNRALARQGLNRLCLHARRLALPHPAGGEKLRLESPLPGDMLAFCTRNFGKLDQKI